MTDTEKSKRRGTYHIVKNDGTCVEYQSKPELTKALAEHGTDDVAHVFKGHVLKIETKKVEHVTVN